MRITVYTNAPECFEDMSEVLREFYPGSEIAQAETPDAFLRHERSELEGWVIEKYDLQGEKFQWTAPLAGDGWEVKRRRRRSVKQGCYWLLRRVTGKQPPWGSLTGIRPTRLFYERLEKGDTPAEAEASLLRQFDLRPGRARLLRETCETQRPFMNPPADAVDVYVGIPFCVTRCSYCSFFAEALGKGRKVPPYLDALAREMDAGADLLRRKGLKVRALYVGGGTPTALNAEQLARVLEQMGRLFPGWREWTVEAGRPDTIDADKLRAMREAGVTRVSVNPQTMNDQTLKLIGRAHTADDVDRAFAMARETGFENINMDLIAALPGETVEDFAHTLDRLAALRPDSVTIHTLARKHGSVMNEFGFHPAPPEVAEAQVELGAQRAREMGMRPYYLYRQKMVAGNLENVAYALPGCESIYNIDIMEETTHILALGAGAISKRIIPEETRIERAPNVGDVGHYIARVDEMIARKEALWQERAPRCARREEENSEGNPKDPNYRNPNQEEE